MKTNLKTRLILPLLLVSSALLIVASCEKEVVPTVAYTITVKDENGSTLGSFQQYKGLGITLKKLQDAGLATRTDGSNVEYFNRFFLEQTFKTAVPRISTFNTATTVYAHFVPETYKNIAYKEGNDFKEAFRFMNEAVIKRITYDTIKEALNEADLHPTESNRMIGIHDHSSLPFTLQPNGTDGSGNVIYTWNREHVWPQSKMKLDSETDGRSLPGSGLTNHRTDMVNLRASDHAVNTARGNGEYGFSPDKGLFQPTYDRGEIARILLYMETAYDLSLTETMGSERLGFNDTQLSRTYGNSKDVLRWWLEEPTPNDFEVRRQTYIQKWQKNRNPFVDEPLFIHSIHDLSTATAR